MNTLSAVDSGPLAQDSPALYEVAASLIGSALARGATDAVAYISDIEGISAIVRGGEFGQPTLCIDRMTVSGTADV
jgi:hypothetical protein